MSGVKNHKQIKISPPTKVQKKIFQYMQSKTVYPFVVRPTKIMVSSVFLYVVHHCEQYK